MKAHAPAVGLAVGLFACLAVAHAAEDILIADFEGDSYGDWRVEGNCFGTRPARGTLNGQQHVSGFRGKGLVNTFLNKDGTTGTLTSPEFRIERKYISFLIGGGPHRTTALELFIDGKVVAHRSGASDETLEPGVFTVEKHMGKTARLRIVDKVAGGWGHVNVDHIQQTDEKPKAPKRLGQQEKEFTVEYKYLVIPIKNGKGGGGQIKLYIDDEEVRRYGLKIAPSADQTDWYAYFTIESYRGKTARVVTSKATEEGFALIRQSETIPGEENFYKEPFRPQFHFTQKVGWNNDPNGMVYHGGKWHFFFQHNPVALPWGNMTWGHATSLDLLYWTQHPNKLFPGTMARAACFSGGATVDKENHSGWGRNTLVAYFTDTGCGECIAYSTDGGDTFTYYEGNPVVRHKGRDPKVIWYKYDAGDTPLDAKARRLGGHWVMVVYDEKGGRNAAFYTSTDMKAWTEQSHLPGYFECTELFELPVDGDKGNTRWVVFAADAKYAIGSFDGKTFTPEHGGKHQVHYVTLRNTDDGIRMFVKPIREIERLRTKTNRLRPQDINGEVALRVGSDLLDVRFTFEVGSADRVSLNIPGRKVDYDVRGQKLNGAALKPVDGKISVQVLCDRSITEIAGNDGRVFMSSKGPPKQDVSRISVTATGGTARLIELEAHELKSIWE